MAAVVVVWMASLAHGARLRLEQAQVGLSSAEQAAPEQVQFGTAGDAEGGTLAAIALGWQNQSQAGAAVSSVGSADGLPAPPTATYTNCVKKCAFATIGSDVAKCIISCKRPSSQRNASCALSDGERAQPLGRIDDCSFDCLAGLESDCGAAGCEVLLAPVAVLRVSGPRGRRLRAARGDRRRHPSKSLHPALKVALSAHPFQQYCMERSPWKQCCTERAPFTNFASNARRPIQLLHGTRTQVWYSAVSSPRRRFAAAESVIWSALPSPSLRRAVASRARGLCPRPWAADIEHRAS
jgi:hypothetical protein